MKNDRRGSLLRELGDSSLYYSYSMLSGDYGQLQRFAHSPNLRDLRKKQHASPSAGTIYHPGNTWTSFLAMVETSNALALSFQWTTGMTLQTVQCLLRSSSNQPLFLLQILDTVAQCSITLADLEALE